MQEFEKRRDRFNFFESFQNPLLNITFRLEVENFLPYCKKNGLPPFHFFLFQLFQATKTIDNFLYRIYEGKVIKIEQLIPSYTVIGKEDLFNYTRFENSDDMNTFIQNSLAARQEAMDSQALINTGAELPVRELKNYIFITSLPWLDFTAIEHPVFQYKSADIPAVAWGKFKVEGNKLTMPFSVQAHHGFVDGFHINLLAERLTKQISKAVK